MKRKGYLFFRKTEWHHSWRCHYLIDIVSDTSCLVSQYGMQILYVYPNLPRRRDAFLTARTQAIIFAACAYLIRSERIRPIILLLQAFGVVFQCVVQYGRHTALARRLASSCCLHRYIGSLPWGVEFNHQQEQYIAQFSHYEIIILFSAAKVAKIMHISIPFSWINNFLTNFSYWRNNFALLLHRFWKSHIRSPFRL